MVDGGLHFWHFPLTIRRISYLIGQPSQLDLRKYYAN